MLFYDPCVSILYTNHYDNNDHRDFNINNYNNIKLCSTLTNFVDYIMVFDWAVKISRVLPE